MLPFLRAANFDPHIVFDPVESSKTPILPDLADQIAAQGFRIIVFQKVYGPGVIPLVHELRARRIKTAFLICDLVIPEMAAVTDITIVTTDFLRTLYPTALQSKIHVVHDGIEHSEVCKSDWGKHRGSRNQPLNAVLVTSSALDELPLLGMPPDWLRVTIVGRYAPRSSLYKRLREIRWELTKRHDFVERFNYLKFRSSRGICCEAWDPVGVYDHMQQADIAIIPIKKEPEYTQGELPPPDWVVKSENRLTMKMAIGLPVIATPIPSYESVIEQGINGYLARTHQEWLEFLTVLREPALRRAMGEKARESVLKRYSKEEQGLRLVGVLQNLCQNVMPIS